MHLFNAGMSIERLCSFRLAWTSYWRQLFIVTWIAAFMPGLRAESAVAPTEYEVKAAFIYNFAKFVTWPQPAFPDEQSPIKIGIVGDDLLNESLTRLIASQQVHGRPFVIARTQALDELTHCHILFIGEPATRRLAQIFAALRQAHSYTLTVSDIDEFLAAGGMIRFIMEDSKVHFQINADPASAAGLTISSKLLRLARNSR